MLAIADPTFHLLILQLVFHAPLIRFLFLRVCFPVDARPEDDVLSHRCSVEGRS